MKTTGISIAILFVTVAAHAQGWFIQQSGVTGRLSKVSFANARVGYVCGFGGMILKTTNSGTGWTVLMSGTSSDLYSVTLTDSLNVWACGSGGTIVKTTNAGVSWSSLNSNTTQILRDISSITSSNIYLQACGDNGTVVLSTNGGTTWFVNNLTNTTARLNAILLDRFQVTSAVVAGSAGALRYSTGGGFGPWPYPGTDELTGLKGWIVPPPTTVYLCSANGTLTTGVASWTWTTVNTGATGVLNGLDVRGNRIWVVGDNGTIRYSSNAGSNWQSQVANITTSLRSICMIDSANGWIVGDGGVIASTHTGGITGVADQNTHPVTFSLMQNYPNPFNPTTKIKFQLPTSGHATLKVYDVLGREVTTVVNTDLKAGSYEVTFSSKNLSSSIYFYQLRAGTFSETRKMLLTK